MTHLSNSLDRICREWCPLINQCPEGHLCHDMDVIRRKIIHITDFEQFKDEFNE